MLSHIVNRKLKCYLRRNLTISFFSFWKFSKDIITNFFKLVILYWGIAN